MGKKLQDGLEVEISCPECRHDTQLIVRTNRHTGNQFLGCPNYPDCRHTRGIPESIRLRLAGQPQLFY